MIKEKLIASFEEANRDLAGLETILFAVNRPASCKKDAKVLADNILANIAVLNSLGGDFGRNWKKAVTSETHLATEDDVEAGKARKVGDEVIDNLAPGLTDIYYKDCKDPKIGKALVAEIVKQVNTWLNMKATDAKAEAERNGVASQIGHVKAKIARLDKAIAMCDKLTDDNDIVEAGGATPEEVEIREHLTKLAMKDFKFFKSVKAVEVEAIAKAEADAYVAEVTKAFVAAVAASERLEEAQVYNNGNAGYFSVQAYHAVREVIRSIKNGDCRDSRLVPILKGARALAKEMESECNFGYAPVDRETIKPIMEEKETIVYNCFEFQGPSCDLSDEDYKIREANGGVQRKYTVNGETKIAQKSGYILRSEEETLNRYIRNVCDDIDEEILNKVMFYMTSKGTDSRIVAATEDIIQIGTRGFEETQFKGVKDHKNRMATILDGKLGVIMVKDPEQKKAPVLYMQDLLWKNAKRWVPVHAEKMKKRNSSEMFYVEDEQYPFISHEDMMKIVASGNGIRYKAANRSTSAARQSKCLFWRFQGKGHWQELQKRLNIVTAGGFDQQIKTISNKDRAKAVKLIERDILEITDASEFGGNAAIGSVAIYVGKWDYAGVAAWDGHFLMNLRIAREMFHQKFGHYPAKGLLEGWLMQCRCRYIKGEAKIVSPFAMKEYLTGNILGNMGMCTGVVYMSKAEYRKQWNQNPGFLNLPEWQNKLVVIGATRLEDVDCAVDLNALKDFFDMSDDQPLSFMAFPPKVKDWNINSSNQIFISYMMKARAIVDNKLVPGWKLMLDAFKSMIDKKIEKLQQNSKQVIPLRMLDNIEGYTDDVILLLNKPTFWANKFLRRSKLQDFTDTLNKDVDGFNIPLEGFNAVGDVDPALLILGIPVLKKNEMFSGNVKRKSRLTAVFRHPKAGESEFSNLWDIPLSTIKSRLFVLRALGLCSKAQYDALMESYRGVHERCAIFPTFDAAFANSHGGSDSDGDAFSCVIEAVFVAALKVIEAKSNDYGSYHGDGRKVTWDWTHGGFNFISVLVEFIEGDNLDVGQAVTFMAKIASLLNESSFYDQDWVILDDEEAANEVDYKRLFAMFASSKQKVYALKNLGKEIKGALSKLFTDSPDRVEYVAQFTANDVKMDGKDVENWFLDTYNKNKVTTKQGYEAWLSDMLVVMSSCIGRTVDAAKTSEPVLVPYYAELAGLVQSALGKGKPGKTSVTLGCKTTKEVIDPETGETVYKDIKPKFELNELEPGFVQKLNKNGELYDAYYIPNCNALKLKNACGKYAIEKLQELKDWVYAEKENATKASVAFKDVDDNKVVALSGIARINSGMSASRPEAYKIARPYIVNSVRTIADKGWFKALSAAFAASATENGMTRFYTVLGPEMALFALKERRNMEKLNHEGEEGFIPEDIRAEAKIETSTGYVFVNGETLDFVDGVADLADGGKAIVDAKINGTFEVTCRNGVPMISILLGDYLKDLAENRVDEDGNPDDRFALAIKGFSGESEENAIKMRSLVARLNTLVLNHPDWKYFVIADGMHARGKCMLMCQTTKGNVKALAQISVPTINLWEANGDNRDAIAALVDRREVKIQEALYYSGKKGGSYGTICVHLGAKVKKSELRTMGEDRINAAVDRFMAN